jgi:hypothetical protein
VRATLTLIVALVITADGTKRVLRLRQGATENATVCVALLEDLQARGLETSRDQPDRVGTVGDAPGHGAGDALAGRGAAAALVRGGPAARRAPVPPGQGHRAMTTLLKVLEGLARAGPTGTGRGGA